MLSIHAGSEASIIDHPFIKLPQQGIDAKGGHSHYDIERNKGGLTPMVHTIIDVLGNHFVSISRPAM